MKKILLIVVLASLLTGCFLAVTPNIKSRSLVDGYYEIDGTTLNRWSKVNVSIYGTKNTKYWNICNSGIQKEKYDALCKKHNDMTWNNAGYGEYQLAVDFLNIEVISDSDFDENHLAGISLTDILQFQSQSIYPFIKSGYKGDYWGAGPYAGITYIDKLLSDLTTDDMIMLGIGRYNDYSHIASLSWLSEPTLSKTHKITVTMTADDGRVFEKSITISWE